MADIDSMIQSFSEDLVEENDELFMELRTFIRSVGEARLADREILTRTADAATTVSVLDELSDIAAMAFYAGAAYTRSNMTVPVDMSLETLSQFMTFLAERY
jgi:hypothetical protein